MSPDGTIRILTADDDAVFRAALRELVAAEPGLELAGEAGESDTAVALAAECRPDVALVDARMPRSGGPETAREIRAVSPLTTVVGLSAYTDRHTVFEFIRAGATGYVVKGTTARELIETIRRCAAGESRLSPEVTGDVVAELSQHLENSGRQRAQGRRLADRIRAVMDGDEARIVFQPIAELETGTVVGLEALARFPADLAGPEAWLAAAESVGLRQSLEIHLARRAIAQIPSVGGDVFVSINVSPDVLPVCPCSEVDPAARARVLLELTEHAQVRDYEALTRALAHLRSDGFRVAIDDAGAGFASLRHILRLAPDFIKLDAELTRGIDRDRSRRALAQGLISFADALGATIVAEGIETAAERDALLQLGVGHGQGYFISRPQPLDALRDLLP